MINGFSVEEINRALANSLTDNYLKKRAISKNRIHELIEEALNSINVSSAYSFEKYFTAYVQTIYQSTSSDLLLFQTYFIGINILIFRNFSRFSNEYYLCLFSSTLVGSVGLTFFSERLINGISAQPLPFFLRKITLSIKTESEKLKVKIWFVFLANLTKITYVLLNLSIRIAFYGLVILDGVTFVPSDERTLFFLVYQGTLGLCISLRNFYLTLKQSIPNAMLIPIQYESLNIPAIKNLMCCISQEDIKLPGKLAKCGHIFELNQIIQYLYENDLCPLCREQVCEGEGNNQLIFVPRNQMEQLDTIH